VNHVRRGVGADSRLGPDFLFAGIGYGGRRFPKDVRSLLNAGKDAGLPMEMLDTTDRVNENQKRLISRLVRERFGEDLSGRTFAVWGLAFKAGTDDLSESPAIAVIEDLLEAGARIRAFDPEAGEKARALLGSAIELGEDLYAACRGADALIVAVEWSEFRRPDLERVRGLLKRPLIFDGRNLYEPNEMSRMGFELVGVGRRSPAKVSEVP